MPLPNELAKALKNISTLHSRHQDLLCGMMMKEVRVQMCQFAKKLKPTTSLKLDAGMGVINFVILRARQPDLWLSSTDIWYNRTGATAGCYLPYPGRLRSEFLFPLVQCLDFMETANSEAGLFPDSIVVQGTKTYCAR